MLKENLAVIESEIQKACQRSGRARDEVSLIAVSKTKPVSDLMEAYHLGVRVFGENKVQELADKFHYTPQHMSSLLKELTGYNFSGYILEKKMQAARDYLLNTTLKIKDISIACGYQNQEHFIRTFRKYYGTTPIDYRNQHSPSIP